MEYLYPTTEKRNIFFHFQGQILIHILLFPHKLNLFSIYSERTAQPCCFSRWLCSESSILELKYRDGTHNRFASVALPWLKSTIVASIEQDVCDSRRSDATARTAIFRCESVYAFYRCDSCRRLERRWCLCDSALSRMRLSGYVIYNFVIEMNPTSGDAENGNDIISNSDTSHPSCPLARLPM